MPNPQYLGIIINPHKAALIPQKSLRINKPMLINNYLKQVIKNQP
jgi:hypothetical protein